MPYKYFTVNGKLALSGGKLLRIFYEYPFIVAHGYTSHYIEFRENKTWAWGYNDKGQIGDNTVISKATPVSLLGNKKTFCKIEGGDSHTIGIEHNGQVWTWGYNNNGRLGDNTTVDKCIPVSILGNKKTFCEIVSSIFSAGIEHNGQVWCWGENGYGSLGNYSTLNKCTPVSIHGNKKTFCQITAGFTYAFAIQHNGQAWGWGYNGFGQLGNNTAVSRCTPVSIHGNKKTFCKISAGDHHIVAIQHNGQIWGWGYNGYGQLGNNSITNQCTPVSVHGNKKTFCQIAGTNLKTLSIDYKGQVWGWGYNDRGSIGNDSSTSVRTPVSIHGAKKTFCQISSGVHHTLAIDHSGKPWAWGGFDFSQLAINLIEDKKTPVGIKDSFNFVSAGDSHAMGIETNGQVWGWGYNIYGMVGDNTITSRRAPVSLLGNKKTFCKIESGYWHTIAIQHNGQIWGWGYNSYGMVGDNTSTSRRTPVSILGNKKTFCQISAGRYHTLGIQHNGQLWGWGYNNIGQIGDNSSTQRLTPVSIHGTKKTFCKITAGGTTSLGIQHNGQVWGWGYNAYGQIGDNTTDDQTRSPVSIHGSKKTFCQISTNRFHTIGLQHNGQIWGWGYGAGGRLGNNSTGGDRTPISIHGVKKTFCQINSSISHAFGLDIYGQAWGWGYNDSGQLGNNSVTNKCTPVSVHGVKKTFCKISTGNGFTIGLDNHNKIWSWGFNVYGQLGNFNSKTPLLINLL